MILALVHRLAMGTWLPSPDSAGLMYLAVSGLIGFSIGDQLLFVALVDVGPRLTTLLMTLTPPVAATLAWIVLDEPLGLISVSGIIVTLAGIAWVALDRPDATVHKPHPHRVRGLCLGAIAAICQAIGLILSKLGMGHTRLPEIEHLEPWSASLVRVTFGAAGICVLLAIRRAGWSAAASGAPTATELGPAADVTELKQLRELPPQKSEVPQAIALLTIGAVLGPVVGVWFSLVAVDRAEAGIAATLMAMTPVLILPFAFIIERQRISGRAIAGACIAVLGVAILTLHSRLSQILSGIWEQIGT
jgi:drug/metabolite transporter (DMT)-like permease